MDERVTSLYFQVGKQVMNVVCTYAQNSSSKYPLFLEWRVPLLGTRLSYWDAIMLMWAMTARHGGVANGENRLPDLNPLGVHLLDLCASHSLSVTNTIFSHKSVHMYTW